MSRFIESIQLKDGQLLNLSLHEQRMQRTIESHFGQQAQIDLSEVKAEVINYPERTYKCRLVYTTKLEDFAFKSYQIRAINSLQVVESQLDYTLKYEDRGELNQLFAQRGECDDIIIVKDGLVTDGSYTNLAFYNGENWWTPAQPLFSGIQRQVLLAQGIIQEKTILSTAIPTFRKVKLFNAMMDWEKAPEVVIGKVKLTSETTECI